MNIRLTEIDFAALSPLLTVLAGALLVLLIETISTSFSKRFSATIALITLSIAFIVNLVVPKSLSPLLTPWLRFDFVTHFFTGFFLAVGFFSTLLGASYFKRHDRSVGEYYFFILSSLFGLMLIAASNDFLTLFIGLETLSLALYVLCVYLKEQKASQEGALKYFLLGGLSTATLLYGIGLIYGAIGTSRFDLLLSSFQKITAFQDKALFLSGVSLITLGLAFKAAIVPFHIWAPDVYEGAPTPVVAFMSVGTKAGAFAAFILVFSLSLEGFDPRFNQAVAFLAVPTLIFANFVAICQTEVRRFFAYSSISHAGFLLIAIAVGTPEATTSLLFYLVIYGIATLGAFGVFLQLGLKSFSFSFTDLQGLIYRSPFLAAVLVVCLLTLAGIPPTVGFLAKLLIFKEAYLAGFFWLVVIALLTTILSAFYYLKIVSSTLTKNLIAQEKVSVYGPAGFVAAVSLLLLGLFSAFPDLLLSYLNPQ